MEFDARTTRYRRYLWLALALLAVLTVVGATGIVRGPFDRLRSLVANPFAALSYAGAFVLLATWSPRRALLATLPGAVVAGALLGLWSADRPLPLWVAALDGLGIAAIGLLAWHARTEAQAHVRLLQSALLVLFVSLSWVALDLTAALWPTTFDADVYAVSLLSGGSLASSMGRLFAAAPWLATLSTAVYIALPLGLALAVGLQARDPDTPHDALRSFLLVAVFGYAIYLVFPVAGPRYALGGWPPVLPEALDAARLVPAAPRNCMPSLHTAWVLVIVWHLRGQALWARITGWTFAALTLAATLGVGWHYAIDLVVAVPFAMAVQAVASAPSARRMRNIAWGFGVTAAWLALILHGRALLGLSAVLTVALQVATVAWALVWERQLWADAAPEPSVEPTPEPRFFRPLAGLFVASGFAGLVYQVVFAKSLGLTFGSTANAATVVLATFMGGLAIGSWIGGRIAPRLRSPIRAYAYAEAAIGVWCIASPWILDALRDLYVGVAAGTDPSAGWLVGLQFALGAVILVVPTLLMGITMPLLTAFMTRSDPSLGRSVGLLYMANTVGAALGALLTGYFLLPAIGVASTLALAVALNLGVALLGLLLGKRATEAEPEAAPPPPETRPGPVALGRAALLVLTVGGFVTFALENTYIHLLAVVVGNSAYAFALMLFSFLIGLGAGSAVSRRWLGRISPAAGLACAQLLLAAAVLAGVFLWNAVPDYFATFERYPLTRSFGARELVRFVVCCAAMLPVAFCIGASYPVAMECVGAAFPKRKVEWMGRGAALNTVGNIVGAVVAGFLLLPAIGSLRSLQLYAALATVLGLVALPWTAGLGRRLVLGSAGVVALLALAQPAQFDLTRLASGANVYFHHQAYGEVVDHAESTDGGLTTINRTRDRSGNAVHTMLTNGKFQGDDSGSREMAAQYAFATVPLLHTAERTRALVIGLGTGVSASVPPAAGFEHTTVVELSGDIVRMAERYFATVNGGVLTRPDVEVKVTDGRNFLLLDRQKYDLVSMEISSIWFAGAASLYNFEFYQLVKQRLSERGVLQQWVQLHRLHFEDVLTVLATVRAAFDHVWLYFVGSQGIIVACSHDCRPTAATFAAIDQRPEMAKIRATFGGGAETLLKGRLLDPGGVNRVVQRLLATGIEDPASTDDNLRLEYNTPRGNVRPYRSSLKENVDGLRRLGRATTAPP